MNEALVPSAPLACDGDDDDDDDDDDDFDCYSQVAPLSLKYVPNNRCYCGGRSMIGPPNCPPFHQSLPFVALHKKQCRCIPHWRPPVGPVVYRMHKTGRGCHPS